MYLYPVHVCLYYFQRFKFNSIHVKLIQTSVNIDSTSVQIAFMHVHIYMTYRSNCFHTCKYGFQLWSYNSNVCLYGFKICQKHSNSCPYGFHIGTHDSQTRPDRLHVDQCNQTVSLYRFHVLWYCSSVCVYLSHVSPYYFQTCANRFHTCSINSDIHIMIPYLHTHTHLKP